ncbi:MAG: AAA family ATPase [Pirellulaceae bacterium]
MIPDDLRALPQWVVWRNVATGGRTTKKPFQVSGLPASSTDPATWADYETIEPHLANHDGPGFVFSADDPYCGIDLDSCRDPATGELAGWADYWLTRFATYAEVSPSGGGVKLIARGRNPLPTGKHVKLDAAPTVDGKAPGIELYDRARFFALTGQVVEGHSAITDCQDAIDELVARYWPAKESSVAPSGPSRLDMVERCWRYVSQVPDAISGDKGHDKTLRAACECLRFGLTDGEAAEVIRRFNALKTGDEQWTGRELEKKLRDARDRVITDGEFGCRLRDDAPANGVARVDPGKPATVKQLVCGFPSLRKPVIRGLLRQGETMNVISTTKVGKSWLVIDLALQIATGGSLFDRFDVEPGRVLIIDNELHAETSAFRIPIVAEARGIALDAYGDRVMIQNVRGSQCDIFTLQRIFDHFQPGELQVVILDAFYRSIPTGVNENDNGMMANLFNVIDQYAKRMGCSFVLVHHATKGNQSGKSVTDVGAGAGSQARATDTHLILRPHEEPGVVVCDAAVRSWPPVEPFCLRWQFPVWQRADELDPTQLRAEWPGRGRRKPVEPKAPPEPEWTAERFAVEVVGDQPGSMATILARAVDLGLSPYKAEQLLKLAEGRQSVFRHKAGPRDKHLFATVPQSSLLTQSL